MKYPSPLLLRCLTPQECRDLASGIGLFELTADFTLSWPEIGLLTVPAGTISDFASVPALVHAYIDRDDPCIAFPAIAHDWLYGLAGQYAPGSWLTRQQVDYGLGQGMRDCGARPDQVFLAVRAVRLFGGSHWGAATVTPKGV